MSSSKSLLVEFGFVGRMMNGGGGVVLWSVEIELDLGFVAHLDAQRRRTT